MGRIYLVGKQNRLLRLQNCCTCREDRVHMMSYCYQDKHFLRGTSNKCLKLLAMLLIDSVQTA